MSTTSYDITNEVPIPHGSGKGKPAKYPFGKMEPGDSFLAPEGGVSVRRAASAYGQRHGKRFTCRSAEGGVRVWRAA